jgi:hypothetical protein
MRRHRAGGGHIPEARRAGVPLCIYRRKTVIVDARGRLGRYYKTSCSSRLLTSMMKPLAVLAAAAVM